MVDWQHPRDASTGIVGQSIGSEAPDRERRPGNSGRMIAHHY